MEKGKKKRTDIKEGIARGQDIHKRGLHSFSPTSAASEVEPPVSLLNCTINLGGRKGRPYLIKIFHFILIIWKSAFQRPAIYAVGLLLYLKLWNLSSVSEKSVYYPEECLWSIYSVSQNMCPLSAILVTIKSQG